MLVDIKEFVKVWKNDIRREVESIFASAPVLGIVQVGDNEASNRYVRNKIKDAVEVGFSPLFTKLPASISHTELVRATSWTQARSDGFMIQLPVPQHIIDNGGPLENYIDRPKDIDGFRKDSTFEPCTPKGIMAYLDYCGFQPEGKNVVIIGRSKIVGKPMAQMMEARNATVTLCHSKTRNVYDFTEKADLVICAVGKANFLDCSRINCPVIDVGINFVDDKMVGDCFNTEGKEVTPVPGGVGLLTRAALMENMLIAAKGNNNILRKKDFEKDLINL